MVLYSWINEPLLQHSLETLNEAKRTYHREILVAKKYAELASGERCLLGESLLYLAIALHDIGKGISAYQRQFSEPTKKRPSFKLHEAYSTCIFIDLIFYLNLKSLADKILALGGALAIALHHHAMNRMSRCIDYRKLSEEVGTVVDAPRELYDVISKVLGEVEINAKIRWYRLKYHACNVANVYREILGELSGGINIFRRLGLIDKHRSDVYNVAECILAPLVRADRKVSSKREGCQETLRAEGK